MTDQSADEKPTFDLFTDPEDMAPGLSRDLIAFGLCAVVTANKARLGLCRQYEIQNFAYAALRMAEDRQVREMATSFLEVVNVDCIAAGEELAENFYKFLDSMTPETKSAIVYGWQKRADLQ